MSTEALPREWLATQNGLMGQVTVAGTGTARDLTPEDLSLQGMVGRAGTARIGVGDCVRQFPEKLLSTSASDTSKLLLIAFMSLMSLMYCDMHCSSYV